MKIAFFWLVAAGFLLSMESRFSQAVHSFAEPLIQTIGGFGK
jgi:hypothetical protein